MSAVADDAEIRGLLARWAFARDQGLWPDLAACYHEDGAMRVSWYSGTAQGFVERSSLLAKTRPASEWSKHFPGAAIVACDGDRALAESDAMVLIRAAIGGIDADTTSYIRFFDRVERRGGAWRIAERAAIYERDRIEPVAPHPDWPQVYAGLDFTGLPEACRHLGASLRKRGRTLAPDILTANSDGERLLKDAGRRWLRGGQT